MMIKKDLIILNGFADRVRRQYPEARIWAFGSRARGDAEEGSDLDVCIVLPSVNRKMRETIREVAWEVGFDNNFVVTTVILNEEQFENGPMSESTLVENILHEGVAA